MKRLLDKILPFLQKARNFGFIALGAFFSVMMFVPFVMTLTRNAVTANLITVAALYLVAAILLSSFFIAKDWTGRKWTILFGWQELDPFFMKSVYAFGILLFGGGATGLLIHTLSR